MDVMKKLFIYVILLGFVVSLSSCGTLFTSSRQTITFTGEKGVGIYDRGKKLAVINDEGVGTARIRKKLSDKTLIAKKEGYKNTPVVLESTFNPISIINLFNVVAWAVDLGTGKCCKWDNTVIEVDMEQSK